MEKAKRVFGLMWTFMTIGLFTFGGGYAMIPLIDDICVGRKKWITHDEMMDITVIAESTPGPIAVTCATYVGYMQAGLAGAAAATVGVVIPSLVIIYLVSLFLDRLLTIRAVASAFKGIKLAVGVLIADTAFNMIKKMKKEPLAIVILCLSAAVMLAVNIFALRFSSIALELIAAAVSLAAYAVRRLIERRKGKEEDEE